MAEFKIELRCFADGRVTSKAVETYITEELCWAGGCRPPEDPLFRGLRVNEIHIHKVDPRAERQAVNIGPLLKFRPGA